MISSKLKPEITCPICNQIFQAPLLLPCGHSICSGCVNKLRKTQIKSNSIISSQYPAVQATQTTTIEDAISEADSGVVVCSAELNNDCHLTSSSSPQSISHTYSAHDLCRLCSTTASRNNSNNNCLKNSHNHQPGLHSENGNTETLPGDILPHNTALENLISRLCKDEVGQQDKDTTLSSGSVKIDNVSLSSIRCQLCESSNDILTLSFCEQCNLWYCKTCLNLWHPPTDMLIKHRVTPFNNHNRLFYSSKQSNSETSGPECVYHSGYICNLYCITCSMFVCLRCLNSPVNERNYNLNHVVNSNNKMITTDSYTSRNSYSFECLSHTGHTVCSTNVYAKRAKTDISKLLQKLSEEAKRGAELVQSLKNTEDQLKKNISTTEALINHEIDTVINALEEKRVNLIEKLHSEVQQRRHFLREQTNQAGNRLTSTTSLICFGVEMIKEREPSAFIQVAPSLKHRLMNTENQIMRETQLCREQYLGDFQLRIGDTKDLLERIQAISLNEIHPPPIPKIILSQCLIESNSIQLVWDLMNTSTPLKNDENEQYHTKRSSTSNSSFCFLNITSASNEVKHTLNSFENLRENSNGHWNSNTSVCCKDLCHSLSTSGLTTPVTNARSRQNYHIPESISAYALMTNSSGVEVNRDQYFQQSGQYCNYQHQNIPLSLSSNQCNLSVPSTPDMNGSYSVNTLHRSMTVNGDMKLLSINNNNNDNHEGSIKFQLEVDNGRGGPFRVAYTGSERVCRLEGLHLNTTYRFRIRSTNGICQSAYSDIVAIKTSRLASFVMNSSSGPNQPVNGLKLSSDGCTISAQGDVEDRVLLGDVGFSDGIHYWEWHVEQYDGRGQPSFGIALSQVSKDKMLGQDEYGWAIYFNSHRSWFLHQGEHRDRTDGGIKITNQDIINEANGISQNISSNKQTIIGVRLDCERGCLAFYLDGEPHGPIAFTNLKVKHHDDKSSHSKDSAKRKYLFYPAISLSHYTRVRLVSGLEVPSESEESADDSSEAEYDLALTSPQLHFSTTSSKNSLIDCNDNNNSSSNNNNTNNNTNNNESENKISILSPPLSTCLVRSTTTPCIRNPSSPSILHRSRKQSVALPKLTTFSRN
uniref:E3 ubiquitin-protein ligase TRIM9 n=1 Tax=Trichobilharzia regenti TaxID=157069 RepID=A0AA85JRZ1_TRIRE|nr:unnamed protein product [Trichobilharzia regenti]